MADISLTASMRTNLLSLQNTQSLMDMTQERLSTGNKVNSAIDNPSSYYTAQGLNNRASDLEALLDSMGQGIQTIKAANEGIESITSFVQQAKAVANTARDTALKPSISTTGTFEAPAANTNISITIGDKTLTYEVKTTDGVDDVATGLGGELAGADLDGIIEISDVGNSIVFSVADGVSFEKSNISITSTDTFGLSLNGSLDTAARDTSMKQYNDILTQIDQLASDASYKGVNLLKDDNLKVVFNEDRSSYLEVKGDNATSAGLGLTQIDDWSTNTLVDNTITAVEEAITKLRNMASEFGNNYSIIQTREDFTENLTNVLTEGADNLTLADMNEESANMLALQTRQQLGVNALSLASQSAQSVLKLF